MQGLNEVSAARKFVNDIELDGLRVFEAEAEPVDFDAVRNQTLVVGSDIVSFVKGVPTEYRHDISNSALLFVSGSAFVAGVI